jgi:hypothetical protein
MSEITPGDLIRSAWLDVEEPTPAPEVGAWRTVPVEPTDAMIDAGYATDALLCRADTSQVYAAMLAASPVVPAPEGVAWRCSGCRRLTDDLDADHAALDAGGFLSCCPERDMKPLYASPVVPVGSGEAVARATCQDCGGHIEGWICQSCDRQFRENDAGDLVFEDQPVFPVGVSREEIARIIDPWAFSVVGNIMHTERASEDRDKAIAKADAILAALRPTDTGWRDIATAPRNGDDVLVCDDETGERHVSYWTGDCWSGRNRFKPTHWMPLPPAPTDTGRE